MLSITGLGYRAEGGQTARRARTPLQLQRARPSDPTYT